MIRLKQCAVLLMVVLMVWTVEPAAACVLPANGTMHPACCDGMPGHCMRAMSMDGSCCQMRDGAPVVEAISPFAQVHDLVVLPHRTELANLTDGQVSSIQTSHPVIPSASPGLGAVLRI